MDSSEMTIEQVVEAILAEARAKGLDAGSPASGGQTAGDQAAGGPVSKSQAPGDSDAGDRERAGQIRRTGHEGDCSKDRRFCFGVERAVERSMSRSTPGSGPSTPSALLSTTRR